MLGPCGGHLFTYDFGHVVGFDQSLCVEQKAMEILVSAFAAMHHSQ